MTHTRSMSQLLATFVLLLTTFLCAGHAFAVSYAGTCFPNRTIPLPEPRESEPYVASGTIELRSSSVSTNPFSYAVYRRACAGGEGTAVLISFKALGIPSGEAPTISVVQAATSIPDVFYSEEPYTAIEGVAKNQNIRLGATVVLNSSVIDHAKAMTLRISGASVVEVEVPDFDAEIYPEANQSLPIKGYVSGSYYDPDFSGEGMLVEVDSREIIFVAWYTYNDDGSPLWLVGNGPVCVDLSDTGAPLPAAKAVCVNPPAVTEVTLLATRGGGFFGNFDPSEVGRVEWGKLRLEWETCSQLRLTLTPTHSDAELPTDSGERRWSKLTGVEGAKCSAGANGL